MKDTINKINFHIFEACNYKCKYCFRNKTIGCCPEKFKPILRQIKETNIIEIINFVGGEPTLNKELLLDLLSFCKDIGLKTTIVTNGSKFKEDPKFLEDVCKYVECIGISIDSLDKQTNIKIGRSDSNKNTIEFEDLKIIHKTILDFNVKFKINIVASEFNFNDESIFKLLELNIDKLKIFKNQKEVGSISNEQFESFINKFRNHPNITNAESLICETDMCNSYLMINGLGQISINENESYDFLEKPEIIYSLIDEINNSENYKERTTNLLDSKKS